MPTYDYVCDACGHAFELFQSMSDGIKKTCPTCGKKKLRRLIGAGGAIMFKGSGFYKTDYRSDSYKKGAAAEKGSTSEGGGSKSEGGGSKSEGGGSKSEGGGSKSEGGGGKSEGGGGKSEGGGGRSEGKSPKSDS